MQSGSNGFVSFDKIVEIILWKYVKLLLLLADKKVRTSF